ncbi:MAG: tyrosine-type recombinase/integrase [Paralcaligenes sp.]
MKLSDVAVKAAKPKGKLSKLPDGTGLYLLVNQIGKYWRYDYRFAGKRKTISYGVYPVMKLAAARDAHLIAKRELSAGRDPMAVRKAERHAESLTFETVARRWHVQWSPEKTAQHAKGVLRRLELDIFPEIGDRSLSDLTVTAFRHAIKKIESRGALDLAKRQLQKCNQIMRFAVINELAEHNPVADLKPSDILPAHKKHNYSRLDAKDLPQLLKDMDVYVGGEHTRLALQLMALTFVRTGELIGATWEEIDLDAARWNIPAERMKMRATHIVPLSKQALAVLQKLQALSYSRPFVFPADTGKPTHMSNNTILYALYRMGYRGRMTGHGFRGVASTILHEQGWPHKHIELQLAHQKRDEVSAAYNHALYLPQRAKMMQSWADYLGALRVDNVTALHRA